MCYERRRAEPEACVDVCVYYCRTYYKAVRGGGRRRVDSEDMCYVLDGVTVDFLDFWSVLSLVCVYYCRTYYKAVRGGGTRGDLIPTIGGSGAHPWRGWDP